jgi:anti-anti-sigma factor
VAYGSRGPDGPQFTVIAEHHGRRSVLRLLGELDVGSADHLRRAVGAVLEQHDPQSLMMDLSALTFTDCAGLAVLVWARKCLAERGHELVITGSQPPVRRVLALTGLATYLGLSVPDGPQGRPPPANARAPADGRRAGVADAHDLPVAFGHAASRDGRQPAADR